MQSTLSCTRAARSFATRIVSRLAVTAVLAVAVMGSAQAADEEWTTLQKVAYTTSIAANIIDWGQTRTIAKNPDKYRELNTFLGDHPSVARVNNYFIGTTALLAVLPHMSDTYRKYMMPMVAAGLTLNIARNHFKVGLKISF